jgi:hypothetical protein
MRLESFQHKYLRAYMILDEGLNEDQMDTNEGFDFIKRRLDSLIKNGARDEVEVILLSYSLFTNFLKNCCLWSLTPNLLLFMHVIVVIYDLLLHIV